MKIVVISSEDGLKFETPIVVEMFKQGLDIFHLRKPSFSEGLLEEYLCAIPEGFHCRIVLHSYHNLVKSYNVRGVHIEKRHKKHWFRTYFKTMYLKFLKPKLSVSTSCHTLSGLTVYTVLFDYVFLNPVFNSISKRNRYAGFSLKNVKLKLQKIKRNNIFALGGVCETNIDISKEVGFGGVVLLGALWKSEEQPLDVFEKVKIQMEEKSIKFN